MNRKLSQALLIATALLTNTVPAYANPFETEASPIFTPAAMPTGNIGNVVAPAAEADANDASPNGTVGNAEISGLGDHDSWVDTGVLAEDPRALCSDVGLGNNEYASSGSNSVSTTSISSSSQSESNHDGGGGGVSILGGLFGANGSGSAQSSDHRTQANDDRYNESSTYASNSSTVEVGRNCDAFVEAAAARDMNYEDNLTERYRIRSGRRGDQVDGLLAVPQN
jgi:hypothetical protein